MIKLSDGTTITLEQLLDDETYKTWTPTSADGHVVGHDLASRLPPLPTQLTGTRTMKIYVGGSSAEMPRAKEWMSQLRAAGHTITSTWVENIEKVAELKKIEPHLAANPMDAPREARAAWSKTGLDELTNADLLWMLLPTPGQKGSAGAYCELGYALMYAVVREVPRLHVPPLGRLGAEDADDPVCSFGIICSGVEQSIFTALVRHYETDQAAFDAITNHGKRTLLDNPAMTYRP